MTDNKIATDTKLEIEIWSDVVCPWCYIGLVRFEKALDAFAHKSEVSVVHRAFQLNPSAPVDDVRPTIEILAQKYGGGLEGAQAMMKQVADVAATEGLTFDQLEGLSGNTSAAHRLLVSIENRDVQNKLLKAMFAHYFTKSGSLFDDEILIALAVQSGLDEDWARTSLASDASASQVAEEQALAASFGATGVPFFVINRKYGVSGAQPTDTFAQVLERAYDDLES